MEGPDPWIVLVPSIHGCSIDNSVISFEAYYYPSHRENHDHDIDGGVKSVYLAITLINMIVFERLSHAEYSRRHQCSAPLPLCNKLYIYTEYGHLWLYSSAASLPPPCSRYLLSHSVACWPLWAESDWTRHGILPPRMQNVVIYFHTTNLVRPWHGTPTLRCEGYFQYHSSFSFFSQQDGRRASCLPLPDACPLRT